ncbi:MAG: 5-formyltetrahydrofolate cyclo-ligase [Synechococcus sp.]|nr:5-formyltetrahydrofolate cyclo-ligase [Synechococcus sp.]
MPPPDSPPPTGPAQPGAAPAAGAAKPELRRHWRARRRALLPPVAAALAAAARRDLPPLVAPPLHLGLYWPLPGEPDLRGLADLGSLRLALPWSPPGQTGPEAGLHYRPWRPGEPLEPDGCGIPAPLGSISLTPAELALLLVPALAVDRRGIRLGSGGGWYDRLRAQPAWRTVPAVAVLPRACVVDRLPADPWDVPFDGWLSEAGLEWRESVASL